MRRLFIGRGVHGRRQFLKFFRENFQHSLQFPNFLLLLYDNPTQLINIFLQITTTNLKIFNTILHGSPPIRMLFANTVRGLDRYFRPA